MKTFTNNKLFWFLALGIVSLYFFTRFYNILGLPIFTDEAIYVRWAQIASNDAAWRFISLTDGKQPLYVWITMVLLKLIDDPLLAGRVTSVITGFFSMVGIFFLTSEIFKNPSTGSGQARKIGLLAAFIYVLYPFSLVYDRMALYDSLVAMFIIWSLYFEILLVRYMRLDLALILGMIVGAGMLTKTNANAAFILLPFLLLLFNFKDKHWKKKLGQLFIYSVVAVVIANAMYVILRLSPFFHIIADKNYVFAYRPDELISAPFAHIIPNLSPLTDWLSLYMTLPFLVLVASAFFISKKYFREKLLLLAWFLIPFFGTAVIARLLYPRHMLFMTMPLLVLGAYALYHMLLFSKKSWLKVIVFVVFLATFVVNDYFIITDFVKASIPRSDKGQFVKGWPSGIGVNETIAFLKEKSKNEKIYVGTEGTFGLMPYALELYLVDNPNIKIRAFWPINDQMPEEVKESAKRMPTYFVFYQPCIPCLDVDKAPSAWPVKVIQSYNREEKSSHYTLYQVENR